MIFKGLSVAKAVGLGSVLLSSAALLAGAYGYSVSQYRGMIKDVAARAYRQGEEATLLRYAEETRRLKEKYEAQAKLREHEVQQRLLESAKRAALAEKKRKIAIQELIDGDPAFMACESQALPPDARVHLPSSLREHG